MAIAIKEITDSDIIKFEEFLNSARRPLPRLKLTPLPYPHDELAVIVTEGNNVEGLMSLAREHALVFCENGNNIMTISKHAPRKYSNDSSFIFSGYVFASGKMQIGMDEFIKSNREPLQIEGQYGEFCLLNINDETIELMSDYFGMVPIFYYSNDGLFVAANSYHLLLLMLNRCGAKLSMNIERSRVNLITSGFTFGAPFSKELDVNECMINLACEKIRYSQKNGLEMIRTSLWNDISTIEEWDDDRYEEYLFKAKEEIAENVRAVFEHERFNKIIVDVSGGFDSRIVFGTACNLPKRLREKMKTHTRKSRTSDDLEIGSTITNLYHYEKYHYKDTDSSDIVCENGDVNLAQVSRSLGCFSVNTHLHISKHDKAMEDTIQLTGGIGDAVFGYKRIRGDVDYKLGDQRLLSRLGACYLWNEVKELRDVFADQKNIINRTLDNYIQNCLFKKFHCLYIDFRNRFIMGSSHIVEYGNLRIPMCASKYALRAKWMYFNLFTNNTVPSEKISLDLMALINPLLASLPYTKENEDVIPKRENLLNPVNVSINTDNTHQRPPRTEKNSNLYLAKLCDYIDNLDIAKQMLLHIYDYSKEYHNVCLCLFKVLDLFEEKPDDQKSSHGREQIRKIYDVYYQMSIIEGE